MSDATRRGLRTALQLLITLLTTTGITTALRALGVPVTDEQWVALTGIALPVITVVMNALEDAGMPALLKAPASDGANPVPDTDAADAPIYE